VAGSAYGLLIGPPLSTASLPRTALQPSAGILEIINTCGTVVMSTPIGASSVQDCGSGLGNGRIPASLQVPVSASADRVYFRDGDTRIRWLTPDGTTGDTTTVPGGPTTISFFSVSPDDQRIAVLVEDFSSPSALSERLYVEDLNGGGHHVDIYSTSQIRGGDGTTLWPMGWHQGKLVLAVIPNCGWALWTIAPREWHVVDPSTGNRLAAITSTCADGVTGTLSYWPSPAGVMCTDNNVSLYDWTGKQTAGYAGFGNPGFQSELSPSGLAWFASGNGRGADESYVQWLGGYEDLRWYAACSWIDDTHLLAPGAVIAQAPYNDIIVSLPAAGICAGSFPGGL